MKLALLIIITTYSGGITSQLLPEKECDFYAATINAKYHFGWVRTIAECIHPGGGIP